MLGLCYERKWTNQPICLNAMGTMGRSDCWCLARTMEELPVIGLECFFIVKLIELKSRCIQALQRDNTVREKNSEVFVTYLTGAFVRTTKENCRALCFNDHCNIIWQEEACSWIFNWLLPICMNFSLPQLPTMCTSLSFSIYSLGQWFPKCLSSRTLFSKCHSY